MADTISWPGIELVPQSFGLLSRAQDFAILIGAEHAESLDHGVAIGTGDCCGTATATAAAHFLPRPSPLPRGLGFSLSAASALALEASARAWAASALALSALARSADFAPFDFEWELLLAWLIFFGVVGDERATVLEAACLPFQQAIDPRLRLPTIAATST